MIVVANTLDLVDDGVIDAAAAQEIQMRARSIMVSLAINAVLCFGILATTGGLIFWLADALSVAVVGSGLLAAGLLVLARSGVLYAMFGNAAALIGAGMLIGGAGLELTGRYPDMAGWLMIPGGAFVAGVAGLALVRTGLTTRFVQGAILLMGLALHLWGIGFAMDLGEIAGWPKAAFFLYASVVIAAAGWLTDVRLVSALALVPFAQVLDTGTSYFHAAYVFYSPESTLSILQMIVLMVGITVWMRGKSQRTARHGAIVRMMAFIVANMCALVGSLWGDRVGQTVWGPGPWYRSADWATREAYETARAAYLESSLFISENVYTVLWALVLIGVIAWAAHRNQRGLFNGAMTFGGIHAYTQMFETFGDEPLAYVLGGLAAIPLAWGMWRLNQHWVTQKEKA